MLEGLAAWVLNNYLGKYVENLNTDQLSIAILSGEVELENLPLRKDALRHLGVPIEIRAGHIGKIKLQIPIRQLRSAPWVIVIERLYLVASPLDLNEWDEAAEELANQERKLAALDAIEACWRLESDATGSGGGPTYYASSYTSWLNYGTGVISDIVENMQLRVRDVHFRYEDPVTQSVCGLTIESLSAQSCDSTWVPLFTTHRDHDLSFKIIELRNLAVYWDEVSVDGFVSNLPPEQLATAMAEEPGAEHRYIVAPVSARAQLQRNRSELPLRSSATPRVVCDLRLDQVPLSLVDWQYQKMVACSRRLEFLSRIQRYRRRRPSVPIKDDPSAWWMYAIVCHVPNACRSRPTWDDYLQRANENVRYVDIYAKMLAQPSAALGADAKHIKDLVEWSRDFKDLKALREVAMRRVPCPASTVASTSTDSTNSRGRNILVRWFPQWWGWRSASVTDESSSTTSGNGTSTAVRERQLEDEILEALADSARNNTLLRRDVVFGKFNFVLSSGTLTLCAGNGENGHCVPMLELQFCELRAAIEFRPRSSSFAIELSLGTLCLRDRLTPGTLFPELVGPPGRDRNNIGFANRANRRQQQRLFVTRSPGLTDEDGPLFTLAYAIGCGVQRLHVRSQPLDVVYQPAAVHWLIEFICAPHQKSTARNRLEAMKIRTKQELMEKWDHMLAGRISNRTLWDIRLDISAPQLILVEQFSDPAAVIAVVDLGTLRLENTYSQQQQNNIQQSSQQQQPPPDDNNDDDDSDNFMTPCSTPPGSGASESDGATPAVAATINESLLHNRLYDTYNVELSDIQVLVGRVRDNWRHAHTKGSSALHVFDRFNISMQIERRIVPTTDPMYPSLTFSANLPRIIAHVNEQKIHSVRILMNVISQSSLLSPFGNVSPLHDDNDDDIVVNNLTTTSTAATAAPDDQNVVEPFKLLIVQFTIDHMSLEVQSRGRSIAELQVSGVTASLTRRSCEINVSLTVHGLLLVDALQTFGPDFELLIASHRHVGIDSMSGSLRDSEPTSPTSPGSPDPSLCHRGTTSPVALTQALYGLAVSPQPHLQTTRGHDTEALISIEFTFVHGSEPLQLANIQFNNLDIIANQETIVELVGFMRRVCPASRKLPIASEVEISTPDEIDNTLPSSEATHTVLTFDFHRLSVLLLRGVVEDGRMVGRKIGTATMCDAHIKATLDRDVSVYCSLGGLQVLDVTPEGRLHRRIISVGRDLLTEEGFSVETERFRYIQHQHQSTSGDCNDVDETAFNFTVRRCLHNEDNEDDELVQVSIRMASVWYTHSPQFITELRSCATEFKQYLKDVARSIRSAATDVALGLVHSRLSSMNDISSPRRFRRRSASSESHTPYTPADYDDDPTSFTVDLKLNVELDSPVLVLPRSAESDDVLVAHLGKITLDNGDGGNTCIYNVEIRDTNIHTVNTGEKRIGCTGLPRASQLYSCETQQAIPVLHDTLLRLNIVKKTDLSIGDVFEMTGCVVNSLRMSLNRAQYEQLLDTFKWLTESATITNVLDSELNLTEIPEEEDGGISTLKMDPHVRAKLFPSASAIRRSNRINSGKDSEPNTKVCLRIRFTAASVGVEIRYEHSDSLVRLSFGDFLFTCDRIQEYETNVCVTLRSLLVEDLLAPEDHVRRRMVATRRNDTVVVTSILADVNAPDFQTVYKSFRRRTVVNLGVIDVVVCASSWIPLLDFFNVTNDEQDVQTIATDDDDDDGDNSDNTTTTINIEALVLLAVRCDARDVAKMYINSLTVNNSRLNSHQHFDGHCRALKILDVTESGHVFAERFISNTGEQALEFCYTRPPRRTGQSELVLIMSSCIYVHTKRFITEIRAFFRDFSSEQYRRQGGMNRVLMEIRVEASLVLLPVCPGHRGLLVLDLSYLTVKNQLDHNIDLTNIVLHDVDMYAGEILPFENDNETLLKVGDELVLNPGRSLLTEKCKLVIEVSQNIRIDDVGHQNDVADVTVYSQLSTLEATLDLHEYSLVKGLLACNLGEDTEHILPSVDYYRLLKEDDDTEVWPLTSIRIELLDVRVHLRPLACINFVRSRLTVESFSDLSQDIDLVSQQILISDERPETRNVFCEILRPVYRKFGEENIVQAEVHSRKSRDRSKFTVLLNNMRVMALADWWHAAREFIFKQHPNPDPDESLTLEQIQRQETEQQSQFKFRLNITDSEIVVVENESSIDANAVILRSTTLLTYIPEITSTVDAKLLSCSVNHLELFSCVLGANRDEDEKTALSIIDPVTMSADVCSRGGILEIQLHELTIRVSYRDILMFGAMLESITKQTQNVRSTVSDPNTLSLNNDVLKLKALGFQQQDCTKALKNCKGRLDEAALWLTQNAVHDKTPPEPAASTLLGISMIEVRANCVRLCLIDDCRDVDVPLTEASMNGLCITYDLTQPEHFDELNGNSLPSCTAQCRLSLDYYNRVLGGWEPFIEPWKCSVNWRLEESIGDTSIRHRINISSDDVLNMNVTDALLSLFRLVKTAWTLDNGTKCGRRFPFVPYSLKNDTGLVLYFATIITGPDEAFRPMEREGDDNVYELYHPNVPWIEVQPGDTVPFSYGSGRSKQRHEESHKMRVHQLAVRVCNWRPAAPVTVDRVGIYFRNVPAERTNNNGPAGRTIRLVFDVCLDGSARKLVTVRSALVIVNKLSDDVDVKLVEVSTVNAVSTSSKTAMVASKNQLAVPLMHAHSHIYIRPFDVNDSYSYCQPVVLWSRATRPGEHIYSTLHCSTNRGTMYWFCCDIRREHYPIDVPVRRLQSPAHTITLIPALLLVNLLPQEIHYAVSVSVDNEQSLVVARGRVAAGSACSVPSVDPETGLELSIHLENFRCATGVAVPNMNMFESVGELICRVRLEDSEKRRLFLNARIEANKRARIRVTITAPFWIVNRTGLPLVFRQEGVSTDTAGQFEEHELARMVAPLLFSFTDQDASPTVVARVGYRHDAPRGCNRNRNQINTPHWSQQFHLRRGVQVRRLRVSHNSSSADTVYVVGIEVRPALGRKHHRRDTNIVTVSPRHQLHNRSALGLEFSQACYASTVTDPVARMSYVQAPPGCHVPFHWPRLDHNQLLCVRLTETTSWSGGLRIDAPLSMHVLLRDSATGHRVLFLHMEVVAHGATYYVVFSDAESLPPPIRVDNCSDVAVTFAQDGCMSGMVARAHHSVPYAWDEPTKSEKMVITAPGGVCAAYDANRLGRGVQLTYENFIYIAFTGTFQTEHDLEYYCEDSSGFHNNKDPSICSQRLVLDVTDSNNRVILALKEPGKRSQLWRMTSIGQLQHEGSSFQSRNDRILVLDIEATAPQPTAPRPSRLILRRSDPRRRSTQTWRFTADGRLCCAHRNMCVQSQDGLLGLRPGSAAVLGVPHEDPPHRTYTQGGVPLEQAVGKQRMRPGSGFLSVEVTIDGPTRVLQVVDMKPKEPTCVLLADEMDWFGVSPAHRPQTSHPTTTTTFGSELQVILMLRSGLGVSVISSGRELLYAQLNNIIAEATTGIRGCDLCVSVQDIQCDNQLSDGTNPVLLYATRPHNADEARRSHTLPILELRAEVQPKAGSVIIFKHLIVCVRPVTVHLDEMLLLRMYDFLLTVSGTSSSNHDPDKDPDPDQDENTKTDDDDDDEEENVASTIGISTSTNSITVRYHFGIIRLVPGAISLSVHKCSSLPTWLRTLKRRLGLTLVSFEDAPVELEPYVRHHPCETGTRLWCSIVDHFRDELLWQAAAILGSVDFLGSPLGLFGDVSKGVSGLIREKSVGALVLNVAHGLSNSAAKVTETLSDGLGRVTMDDAHEEMRQRIRRKHVHTSGGDHLVAGIKGLGFGILGGATGIFKQVYEGATSDGLQGIFSGLGKGIVGVVAKPVVGVLDLATETARAVRDSSRGANRTIPERRRQPRAIPAPGGLLSTYSAKNSHGQAYLRTLTASNEELYVAYECVRSGADDLRVIVSNERVRVVTRGGGGGGTDTLLTIVTETGLDELVACTPVTHENKYYIEMTVRSVSEPSTSRRPLIRCDTDEMARAVSRQVNYAKRLYEEAARTLRPTDD